MYKLCKDASVTTNTFDDLREKSLDASQFYNPPMTLEYNNQSAIIGCGTSDDITVYEDQDNTLYVLSINSGLSYCALALYNKNNLSEIWDHFVDGDSFNHPCDIQESLDELSHGDLINYLMQWY